MSGLYDSHGWVKPGHPSYVDKDPKGGKAKHVFGSHDTDVSHVWANPLESDGSGYYQTHGRNPQSNYFFKTDRDGTRVLYSYRESYPVASLFTVGRKRVYLVRSGQPYSVTTSTHINGAHHAIPSGSLVFDVPYVTRYRFESKSSLPMYGGNSWNSQTADEGQPDKKTHKANLLDIVNRLTEEISKYESARATYRMQSYYRGSKELRETAKQYARVFGLKLPKLPVLPKWDKRKFAAAKLAAEARDAREREARDRRAAEYEREQAENIVLWKSGADVWIGHTRHAFLRVIHKDGMAYVETSQRVSVPVSGHAGAARLLRFLRALKDSGREYVRNGHTEHIGTFTVDSFVPESIPSLHGSLVQELKTAAEMREQEQNREYILTAGCHRIRWAEIQSIAADVLRAEEQEQYDQANLEHARENDIPTAE